MGFATGLQAGTQAAMRPQELTETTRANKARESIDVGRLGIQRKQLALQKADLDYREALAKSQQEEAQADRDAQSKRDVSSAAYQQGALANEQERIGLSRQQQQWEQSPQNPQLRKSQIEIEQYEKQKRIQDLQDEWLTSMGFSESERAKVLAKTQAGMYYVNDALKELSVGKFTSAQKALSVMLGGSFMISQAEDGRIVIRGGMPGSTPTYYNELNSPLELGAMLSRLPIDLEWSSRVTGWPKAQSAGIKTSMGTKAESVGSETPGEVTQKEYRELQTIMDEYFPKDEITGVRPKGFAEAMGLVSKYRSEGVSIWEAVQMALDPNKAIIAAHGGKGTAGKYISGSTATPRAMQETTGDEPVKIPTPDEMRLVLGNKGRRETVKERTDLPRPEARGVVEEPQLDLGEKEYYKIMKKLNEVEKIRQSRPEVGVSTTPKTESQTETVPAIPAARAKAIKSQEEKFLDNMAKLSQSRLGKAGQAPAQALVDGLMYFTDIVISQPAKALATLSDDTLNLVRGFIGSLSRLKGKYKDRQEVAIEYLSGKSKKKG